MSKTKDFRYEAVVDWIEFEVTLITPAAPWAIQKYLDVKYVKGMDKQSRNTSQRVRFRIHDVNRWKLVKETISTLCARYRIEGLPLITGIEVSFDTYHNYHDPDVLRQTTAERYWLLQKPVSSNQRIANEVMAQGTFNHAYNLRQINLGKTVYIGNKTDSISQRIYFKTHDNNLLMDSFFHRARYEVTFQHDAVPFHTIAEGAEFDFTLLAKYFKFRVLKPGLDDFSVMIAEQLGQVQSYIRRKKNGVPVRVHNIDTLANTHLNQTAYECLRGLTQRWKSAADCDRIRKLRKNAYPYLN